jgi:hypothetical protein
MSNNEENDWPDRQQGQGLIPVCVARPTGYGSVPGLDDEELADLAELERQVMIAEWGPILALPVKRPRSHIRPTVDQEGKLDWGAFGTMDFERLYGAFFDGCRYKIDRLREELRNEVIAMETHSAKIPGHVVDVLSRGLREGWIDINELEDWNHFFFARRYLRVQRIKAHIRRLKACRGRPLKEPGSNVRPVGPPADGDVCLSR